MTTTATTEDEGALIKVDCIGRVRTTSKQREALLDAFAGSCLSGPEFAARHGVKYQTFATWLQKRKRNTGQYPLVRPGDHRQAFPLLLAEVECHEPSKPSATPLEVILPGGASVMIRDEAQLAFAVKLIRQLGQPC